MSEQPEPTEPNPDILETVERAISALQSHPDAEVRAQVTALLEGLDAVHRTGLTHLVSGIQSMGGDAFINRLVGDPAIRLLLTSYDLLAADRRLLAEEAIDAVRGHLHAHGVDVQLSEVVGGVVYAHLHQRTEEEVLPVDAVRRDLEEALKEGLLGFQELVIGDRVNTGPPSKLYSIEGMNRPVYQRVMGADEIPAGEMKAVDLEGQKILLANIDGQVYAVRNQCGESPFPLEYSKLTGSELCCSWHGCRYDIRSGERLDEGVDRLLVLPVREQEGNIEVAIGVESAGSES